MDADNGKTGDLDCIGINNERPGSGDSESVEVGSGGYNKGLFDWIVLAVNLAGLITNTVSPASYVLAGFGQREVSSSATSLGAGLAPIGSVVSNPNNIIFENASEGGSGPNGGTTYSYQAYPNGTQLDNSYDVDNKFTVCDQNGSTNTNGDFVFNLDKLNRAANTSTSNPAKFIIEEN